MSRERLTVVLSQAQGKNPIKRGLEESLAAALLMEPEGANRMFARPVKDVMTTRLETISADAPIADLVPLFRKDYIAIVMDGDQFLGVATRLDLINHFRIA